MRLQLLVFLRSLFIYFSAPLSYFFFALGVWDLEVGITHAVQRQRDPRTADKPHALMKGYGPCTYVCTRLLLSLSLSRRFELLRNSTRSHSYIILPQYLMRTIYIARPHTREHGQSNRIRQLILSGPRPSLYYARLFLSSS